MLIADASTPSDPGSARRGREGNTDGCFAVATRDKSSRHWRNDFDGTAITRWPRESVHRKDTAGGGGGGEGRRWWRETWHEVVNRNPLTFILHDGNIYRCPTIGSNFE